MAPIIFLGSSRVAAIGLIRWKRAHMRVISPNAATARYLLPEEFSEAR